MCPYSLRERILRNSKPIELLHDILTVVLSRSLRSSELRKQDNIKIWSLSHLAEIWLNRKHATIRNFLIDYEDEFSSKMLLLVIFLVTFFKTSYLSAAYPQVVSSSSISHERNNAIIREKECFVGKLCEYKIFVENFSCNVTEYVVSYFLHYASASNDSSEVTKGRENIFS